MDNDEFADFIRTKLVSPNGYVCDWGQNFHVNKILAEELERKIKKHPLLWKIFFMIAYRRK